MRMPQVSSLHRGKAHHHNCDDWLHVIVEGLILDGAQMDLSVSILMKLWTSAIEVFQILSVRRLPPPHGGVILTRRAWSRCQ